MSEIFDETANNPAEAVAPAEESTTAEPITVAEEFAPPEPEDDTAAKRIAELEAQLAAKDEVIAKQSEALAEKDEIIGEKAENEAQIQESLEKGKRLKARMLQDKQSASESKKAFDAWMEEDVELRDELNSPQARLPFRAIPAPVAASAKPVEPVAPKPVASADDESWKGVVLSSLMLKDGSPLPRGIVEAYADIVPPILTVGDLADHSRKPWVEKVKGIGPAKQEQLDEALEVFWASRALDAKEAINAELVAGVKEAEAARPDGWKLRPIADLKLEAWQLEILVDSGVTTVEEVWDLIEAEDVDELALVDSRLNEAAIREAIDQLIESHANAAGLPQDEPAAPPSPSAWRTVPASVLGLPGALADALDRGGLATIEDVAQAIFTDYVDSVPGFDTDQDVAELRSRFDRWRVTLPNSQAFDLEEFIGSLVPSDADNKPVRSTRKKRDKAASA